MFDTFFVFLSYLKNPALLKRFPPFVTLYHLQLPTAGLLVSLPGHVMGTYTPHWLRFPGLKPDRCRSIEFLEVDTLSGSLVHIWVGLDRFAP